MQDQKSLLMCMLQQNPAQLKLDVWIPPLTNIVAGSGKPKPCQIFLCVKPAATIVLCTVICIQHSTPKSIIGGQPIHSEARDDQSLHKSPSDHS